MKILLSYASEYDKGEGVHWARVLRSLGHEVHEVNLAASINGLGVPGRTVRGYPHEVTIDELLSEFPGTSLFFYIEPLALLPRGLESSPVPTVCIISDAHRKLEPRLRLAELFDRVFLYHRNYIEEFRGRVRGEVRWLPIACDTEMFHDLGSPRDLDVAFVGQLFGPGSERRRIISRLADKYRVNEQRYYRQNEIPGVYSRSRIVVNLPVGDDLNTRFFEALSCGALLITRRTNNGQEELFKEGVHYVGFGDEQELFEKVAYYLQHDEERARIARAGCAEVQNLHTLKRRAQSLLDGIDGNRSASVRGMSKEAAADVYAAIYEENGCVETLLREAASQRQAPMSRFRLLMRVMRSVVRRAVNGW